MFYMEDRHTGCVDEPYFHADLRCMDRAGIEEICTLPPCDPGQVPVIVACQAAENQDDEETADHSGCLILRNLEDAGHADGACDGGNRIDVLNEDIRHLIRHDISQRTASDTGDKAEEDQQEDIIIVAVIYADDNPVDHKGGQSQRIEPEHDGIIDRQQTLGHLPVIIDQKKDQCSDSDGHEDIEGIPEHIGRDVADDKVAEQAAAAGGGDSQHIHAEDIHLLMNRSEGAGTCEGHGTDEVEQGEKGCTHDSSSEHT